MVMNQVRQKTVKVSFMTALAYCLSTVQAQGEGNKKEQLDSWSWGDRVEQPGRQKQLVFTRQNNRRDKVGKKSPDICGVSVLGIRQRTDQLHTYKETTRDERGIV